MFFFFKDQHETWLHAWLSTLAAELASLLACFRETIDKKGTLRRKAGSAACLFVACLAQNIFLAETFFIFSLLGLFKVFVATLGSMSGGLCAQRVAPLALKLAVSWSLLRNCLAAGCAGSLVVSKDDARRSLFDTARDRPSLLEESKCLYKILRGESPSPIFRSED